MKTKELLECQTQSGIRKHFDSGKKYIIRIREKGDIIYHNGIKILELSNSNLKVSDAIFHFNRESFFNAKEKLKEEGKSKVKEHILSQMNTLRESLCKEGKLKISSNCYVEIERNYKKNFSMTEQEGLKNILTYLKPYDVDIEYKKEYKLKHRNQLPNSTQKEIEEFVLKQKENLEKSLGLNLQFSTIYQVSSTKILEEQLENYCKEKGRNQKEIEATWTKKYVLSFTIPSKESIEQKQILQEKLCTDDIFTQWEEKINPLPENQKENIELDDSIIYHINSYKNRDELAEIEYGIIRNRIFDENLEYKQLSIPKFHTMETINLNIKKWKSFDEIDSLAEQMEKKVESYVDYVKDEVEKHYQFQFMLQDETKKKIKHAILTDSEKIPYQKVTKNLYQTIYPFEQEYFILKKSGRIDTIFLDVKENQHADLYLIELKVNESVIGGTNGVHKHLSDIYRLLNKKNEEFRKEIKGYIDYRRKALDESEIKKIDKIHFWTVIGTTDNNHKKVSEKLLQFYNQKESIISKQELQKLKEQYPLLKDKDITIPKDSDSLKESMKKLKGLGCEVKFFFDDWNQKEMHDTEMEEITFE